ncbi:MAG: hypothetical protein DRP71_01750 [Verrucomicrobia bacterium]|nr:MAG: hypothetical protein DRP71_01750 [Verrucomicrobiota bacterium]
MITRRIGKLLRGKATPFQVFSAGVLGALIAFTPGFSQAPGLMLLWFFLLAVLNANLFVAAIVGAGSALLALLLTPASFAVGRVLLEGPTEGLFRTVVNAPVLAFFGFDYYLVAGGQLIGVIVGVLAGFAVARLLTGFRTKLSQMETGSERFKKWSSKKSVRIMTFIFVGGAKKKTYEELMTKRIGNPIRPIGVVLVVLTIVVIFVTLQFFQGPIITAALRSGLEKANGATVDVAEADLDPTAGKLTVIGLAMANPNLLEEDIFRAEMVEADISLSDVLRKRVVLDRVVVDNATNGELRKVPGRLVGPRPKPAKEKTDLPDMKSIDQVLDNAKVWKERLSQVKKWLDSLGGSGEKESSEPGAPGYREQLEARIRSLGYANVRALHLIEGSPSLLVKKLEVPRLKAKQFPDELLMIEGSNLSTNPNLVAEPPTIDVSSSGGTLKVDLTLGSAAGGTDNQITFAYRGLPVDSFAEHLTVGGTTPISGGTMDVTTSGTLSATDSNLPLSVTFNNTNVIIGGTATPVSALTIPVAVRGPMDNPMIRVDSAALQNALLAAGKQEAVNRLQSEAAKQLGVDAGEGGENLEDTAKSLLGGFLKKQSEPKDDGE